jgi:protein TonB
MSALLAMVITFGLFLFMHQLISSGRGDRADPGAIAGIRFGSVEIPDEIVIKNRRKPRKPPAPVDPPPTPKMQISRADQQVRNIPAVNMPDLDIPLPGGEGMFLGNFKQVDQTAEGDIIPIVVIRPVYPQSAAISGTEGWVKIEFTITEAGIVENPHVVDSKPARVFDRAAILAILKWKFKPRVVEGVAVDRQASQIIEFTLDDATGN